MRTFSLIHTTGQAPRHFATRLEARAELVRSGDPSAFVAALNAEDHSVLSAEGPRALALLLLSRAAAVTCPEHGSGPGAPCEPGPARVCPERMDAAGFIPFVKGQNGAGSPADVLAGLTHASNRPRPRKRRTARQETHHD